jgi:hypothetical protein
VGTFFGFRLNSKFRSGTPFGRTHQGTEGDFGQLTTAAELVRSGAAIDYGGAERPALVQGEPATKN